MVAARELYRAGLAAVAEGRWRDALDRFERAYALSGVPATLYNAATTLRALGRHRDARDAFDHLLQAHVDLGVPLRASARRLRDEGDARIATIRLGGLPAAHADLRLRLDDTALADSGERPLAFEIDPGAHTLVVDAPERRPFVWQRQVRDGEDVLVDVVLEPSAPRGSGAAAGGSASSGDEGGFTIPTAVWIAAGVVLVVVAVGVIGYLLWDGTQPDPAFPDVREL